MENLELILKSLDLPGVKVVRNYSVRGIAISSKDSKRVYIDSEVPSTLVLSSGHKVNIDRYLCIHEIVEKSLMDKLGYVYDHAHEMALHAEHDALKRDSIPLKEYDSFMFHWMKQTENRTRNLPPDQYDIHTNDKMKHHGVPHMFDKIKKSLEAVKEVLAKALVKYGNDEPKEMSDEDKIKRTKLQNKIPSEPSLKDQVEEMKIKYGASSDKTKTFDEKVKDIKRKYKTPVDHVE